MRMEGIYDEVFHVYSVVVCIYYPIDNALAPPDRHHNRCESSLINGDSLCNVKCRNLGQTIKRGRLKLERLPDRMAGDVRLAFPWVHCFGTPGGYVDELSCFLVAVMIRCCLNNSQGTYQSHV